MNIGVESAKITMAKKKVSPVTELSEQATAYAADGRMNPGFMPQCSATTDSNCSAHSNNNGILIRFDERRLILSPVTEQSEQATAYAADGKMNYGFML